MEEGAGIRPHPHQETARILAVTAITMFLKAIARQWKLSEKNAGKAVDFASL